MMSAAIGVRAGALRGFTLVEAVAAMIVISTIVGLAGPITLRAVEAYRGTAVASLLHSEAAAALERIDRALRETVTNASNDGPDVQSITAQSIVWTTSEGVAQLQLDAGNLRFAPPGEPLTTLLSGVTGLQVRALNESGTELGVPLSGAATKAIRRVEVTLTLTRDGSSQTLRCRVFLRCMMRGFGT